MFCPHKPLIQSIFARVFWHFLLFSLVFNPVVVYAQTLPITPDGTTNTQVTQTASGIDQINIAAPNAAGLSHNKFTDYNVNTSGQIINNFSGKNSAEIEAGSGASAVTQTQIGGLVAANGNLSDSGSARIILNEVTSGNVSKLLGYTEIAGTKADLILANPNGIACSGCGFINTARLFMIAGSSNFDANGNLGFNLKEQTNPNLYVPLITIDGLGLDVSRTTATDIIASSVKLLSSIYGSDSTTLTIKTGEGNYDYASTEISKDSNNIQNNSQPVFAIDASNLAQIQAGQIYLIATKQGVGVKMESEILASQTLNLDANGDIYYKSISAGNSATLKSSGTIQTSDASSIISAPTVNVTANQFSNLGSVSAYNLNIQNTEILTNLGSLKALNLSLSNITNLNNSGLISSTNTLSISGDNLSNQKNAKIYSPLDYTITLSGLLTNSGLIGSGNNLTINSNQLQNFSEISAKNNLTFSITNSVTNSGSLIATKDIDFTANSLTNSGEIQSSGVAVFNLFSLTNNENSSIYSDTDLTLKLSSSLLNFGAISSQGDLTISGTSNISNSSKILSSGDLNITATSVTNNQDAIISALSKSLTATLSANLQNDGDIKSATNLTLLVNSLSNSGNILAGKISQTKAEDSEEIVTSIDSLGTLEITSNSTLNNLGKLQSTQNSKLDSAILSNSGTIYSFDTLTITSINFDNLASASIYADGATTFTLNGYLNNESDIQSNSSLKFTIKNLNNSSNSNSGNIIAGSLTITSADDLRNFGTIGSYNDITISAKNLTNSSDIKALTTAEINLIGNLTNTEEALIYSQSQLTLSASGSLSNLGEISTLSSANLTFSNITNSNKILADKSLTINSAAIDNNNANSILASVNQDLNLNITDFLTNLGTIFAKTTLTLGNEVELNSINNSGEISFTKLANTNSELKVKDFTNSGTFLSNDALTISAQNLSNSPNNIGDPITNLVIASLSSSLTLNISNQLTNSGQLSSFSDLTITANNFTNNANANVLAGAKLDVKTNAANNSSDNSITNSGNLQSLGTTTLNSASLNNYGTIKSFGASTININSITNQENALIFSGLNSTITSNSSLTNWGIILANANLTINSGTTTNNKQIYSVGNLTLNLTNTLTNNSLASVSSLGNLTISGNVSVNNYNQIASSSNLSITAASLTNSKSIQADGNLTLNLSDTLTNNINADITSGGVFDINNSLTVLNNSGTIHSGSTFTINVASLTNSSNALILGNGDVKITANSIDNSNTKPTSSSATSGIISSLGDVILKTDFLNNAAGLVMGKIADVSYLNGSSMSMAPLGGSFIFSEAILLDLGDTNYINTATLNASTINITANNITNTGNVTATDYIKLNATGSDGLAGSGNITNGSASGNNADTQLAAGSYINFTAKNNILNYGTISATTDLTLTSTTGSINNYSSGKITGGSGTTTINATQFNNASSTSVLTAANNLIFNLSDDLNNYGEISVANNLTANVSDGIYNYNGALIWSGNDITLNVANTLLNISSDIYANNNLTIQKNSSGDKTTLVQNVSGNIETYNGDIVIKAATLENKRLVDVVDKRLATPLTWDDNQSVINAGWTLVDDWCHGNHCNNKSHDYFASITANSNSISGKINSGHDLTISANTISNNISEIYAANNINISTNTINNYGTVDLVGNVIYRINNYEGLRSYFMNPMDNYHDTYGVSFRLFKPSGYSYGADHAHFDGRSNDGWIEYAISMPGFHYETFSSNIKSGGSMSIAAASNINNSIVTQNTSVTSATQQSKSTTINHIDSYTLAQTGVVNVDLSKITSAINSNNSAASGSSVGIETEPKSTVHKGSVSDTTSAAATDSTSQNGINPTSLTASTANTVFAGNFKINLNAAATTPLVESRSQFTDASQFFGSKDYFSALGLNGANVVADLERQTRITNIRMLGDSFVETQLIMDQIHALTNDSLLLSQSKTDANQQIKELFDNSVNQFAALGLNAETVATKGLTTAQANSLTKDIITFELTTVNGISVLAPKLYLSQTTRDRLLNNGTTSDGTSLAGSGSLASGATIFAGKDLTINSPTASLTNNGSIIANGNVAMNLASLSSISVTIPTAPTVIQMPVIKSVSGDITIAASNNVTLKNTLLNSGNTISIAASNDVTLKNTLLNSGNKISIAAKDISISNDPITLTAPSLAASSFNQKSGLFSASSIKDDASTARSNITFNAASDISLTSTGSINIANNYLNTGGSIFMTAATDINNSNYTIKASDNVVMSAGNNINNIHKDAGINSSNSTATTNETRIEAGNIVSLDAGNDINNIGATIKGGSLVYLTAGNDINNQALINYQINGQQTNSDGSSITETQAQSSNAGNIKSTLVSQGNIESGGNLVMVAGNDLNNKGSNITSTGSAYLEATNGNINITTAQLRDRTVSRWGGRKKGGISISDNTTNLSSEISSGGTLELASGTDINIKGSDLTTTNSGSNIKLTAANDVNITAAQDTKYSQTQTWKKGTTVSKSSNSGAASVTNVLSDVTAENGDISITSNADTNLIGAKLKSINLDINTGDELNIYSVSDQNKSWSSSTKSRSLSGIDGGLGGLSFITAISNFTPVGITLSNQGIDPSDKSSSLSKSADKTSNISSVVEATGSVNLASNQDLTISGSNVYGTTGSLISDQGNINILAAQEVEKISSSTSDASRETKVPGFKGVKHNSGETTETVTNVASNLTFTDSILLKTNGNSTSSEQSANINIVGSNLTVSGGDLTLTSANNIIIANAVDSVSKESSGSKRNETKKSVSTSVDYVETAASSSLSATNITLNANTSDSGTVLVQGSNLSSTNNIDINSINTTIRGADLSQYHYAHTSKGYSGIGSVAANITSTALGIVGGVFHLAGNIAAPLDGGLARSSTDELFMDNSLYNIKVKTIDTGSTNSIISSNITAGNNLTLNSTKDVTIEASNLKAGTADTTPDQSDSTIEGKVSISANNLYILAGQEFSLNTHETKTTRTLQFNNWSEGSAATNTINSQISAKNDGFIMNVANQITASYDSKKFDEVNGTLNSTENSSGLNYLIYLKNNQGNVLYNPVDEIQKQWADASRGLTEAGTAVVVVGAVVATVLTAGTLAPVTAAAAAAGTVSVATTTFVVSTAVVSSAMATASVSATNISMNVDGDIFKQTKDIGKTTAKDTFSDESLKNMAIAGLTAAATMGISYGISSMSEAANGANAANGATAANGANTVNSSGQVANASQFPTALDSASTSLSYNPSSFNLGNSTSLASNATSATSTVTMTDRFVTALQNSVVQTVSSSAAQSVVNGDSFTDSLKNSTKNLLINAVGELGANEIGTSFKAGTISKAQQLVLHAGLGCGMAAAGGNNCAAGAASGVIGEATAEFLSNNTNLNKPQIIESAKLAGAITSAAVAGPDDGDSVFAGSQIARNAAENNYLSPKEKGDLVKELKACGGDALCESGVQAKYVSISKPRDEEFKQLYANCSDGDQVACSGFKAIHYNLRMKLTEEGNEYYLTHKDEFKLLPASASVFHTFQRDPETKEVINVLTGRESGVTKYVHPIYGYEVVLDTNKNIITDPLNIGTYNFYNPNLGIGNSLLEDSSGFTNKYFGNHKEFDVDPYFDFGNSQNDPTLKSQRFLRNINAINR